MNDLDKTQIFVPAVHGRPAPDAKLIRVTRGANSPEIIPLVGAGLSLVRDPAGNLSVSDSDTSNFKIFQIGGAWGIQALASDAPVVVNKKRLTVSYLRSGDDIDFGGTCYIFRWADEPEHAETSPAPPAPEQTAVAQKVAPERGIRRFELEIAILVMELVIILAGVLAMGLALI